MRSKIPVEYQRISSTWVRDLPLTISFLMDFRKILENSNAIAMTFRMIIEVLFDILSRKLSINAWKTAI